MGVEIFGFVLFDFSSQLTYADAFFTIFVVGFIFAISFLLLKFYAHKK